MPNNEVINLNRFCSFAPGRRLYQNCLSPKVQGLYIGLVIRPQLLCGPSIISLDFSPRFLLFFPQRNSVAFPFFFFCCFLPYTLHSAPARDRAHGTRHTDLGRERHGRNANPQADKRGSIARPRYSPCSSMDSTGVE